MTMKWFKKSEREQWASPAALSNPQGYLGLTALGGRTRELYEKALPRGVLAPRLTPDRPRVNYWMPPHELAKYYFELGQIILGKLGERYLGYLDDRPLVTIAGARAGKTSTVLEPNLYLYPGSMLVLDPKGELSTTAAVRRALGHQVYVLDPFGQSGQESASFNVLDELNPESWTVTDDVASITQALIVDDGNDRARHWNDSARALLKGIILLTLTFEPGERNFITARELLLLSYSPLVLALQKRPHPSETGQPDEEFYNENRRGVETLLKAMSKAGGRFGGILAGIGNRFLATPHTERGSVFSTAAAQTDFLDSLPLRHISRRSDFKLESLRGERPTTIFLCLSGPS
jgi:type IV secretion system protein VirD4